MTKELRRLSIVMLLMFIALFASTSWIQAINAESLAQHPNNIRTRLDTAEIQRGPIIAGGEVIASSVPSGDSLSWQRQYVDAPMWAPITGYYNALLSSSTGIEREMNSELSGVGAWAFFSEIDRIVSGTPAAGDSVELTINPNVQRVAYEALGNLQGSVMAMNPQTGQILAMVSTPSFDTNLLAVHSAADADAAEADLLADPRQPMSDRAIGGRLNPPGSTFKILVAAAAYDSGDFTPESTFPNPARYTLPGTSVNIQNAGGGTCGPGETVSIAEAVRLSCNIPLAQLAVALGHTSIREMAERVGWNSTVDIPMTSTASSYPRTLDDPQTALTGFGQGQVTATTLQVLMMASAIANDGILMNPHLVESVIGTDLSVKQRTEPSEYGRAMDASVANDVTASMVASVTNGAGTGARIDGVSVAGKTGTSENQGTQPYTLWFTGFAPAENPQVVVAVLVEDGGGQGQTGSGNSLAAPIAKKVIEAVLNG